MSAEDLVKQATALAQQGHDLYALLETSAAATSADIHRAWKRKNLQHHPDKAGTAFDPELYARLEHARAVLADDEARGTYDAAIGAARARTQERAALDDDRRRMVEDLEAREAAGRLAREGKAGPPPRKQQQQQQQGGDEQEGSATRAHTREMRRMAEEDARRLHEERESLERAARERKRREETAKREKKERRENEAKKSERELERQLEEKMIRWTALRRQREKRSGGADANTDADADSDANAATNEDVLPTSGPAVWQWTRNMLVAEQRVREAKRAKMA